MKHIFLLFSYTYVILKHSCYLPLGSPKVYKGIELLLVKRVSGALEWYIVMSEEKHINNTQNNNKTLTAPKTTIRYHIIPRKHNNKQFYSFLCAHHGCMLGVTQYKQIHVAVRSDTYYHVSPSFRFSYPCSLQILAENFAKKTLDEIKYWCVNALKISYEKTV